MNYYVKHELESLQRSLKSAKAECDAWKKVSTVTKKDGKPFSVFTKNFVNCTFSINAWNFAPYEKTMYVCFLGNGYETSEIDCFKRLSKDEIYEDFSSRYSYGYGTGIVYSVDGMMDAVKNRIDYLARYIADLESAIENISKLETFYSTVESLLNDLEAENKQLYYSARNTMKTIM